MNPLSSASSQTLALQAYFKEYDYLKQEQLNSINARNYVIFMLLFIYCGGFAYALANPSSYHTFLMLPWACFILGWLYFGLQNKIIAIRFYLRDTLSPHIIELSGMPPDTPFSNEKIFLARYPRWLRKLFEIIINLYLFCMPSIIALGMYFSLPVSGNLDMTTTAMIATDIVFIIVLAVWVVMYSDIARRTNPFPSD
jgi:hypothetical protein